ncbi:hypothetical protein M153_7700020125 [Pseudoloma neurophilia]|uniref:Uncharacterized protein n=1 Tax=Pseudoloma neurophilia TaxID=146866 RepID=A0A0R0M7T1_9MICR|nr:hypothetical protein M153_7700020125 [Pseudoloma neurophilia]
MLNLFLSLNFILTGSVSEITRRKTKSLDLENRKVNRNNWTLDFWPGKKKSFKDKDLSDNVQTENSLQESKKSSFSFKSKPKLRHSYEFERKPAFEFNQSMKYKLIIEIQDEKTNRRYFMNPENLIKMMLNQEACKTSECEFMNIKPENEKMNVNRNKSADDLIYTLKNCQSQIIKLICRVNKFNLPDELEKDDSEIHNDEKNILEGNKEIGNEFSEETSQLKSEMDKLKSKNASSGFTDIVKSEEASPVSTDICKMPEEINIEQEESSSIILDKYLTTFERSDPKPEKITADASIETDPRDGNTGIFGKINIISTGCNKFDFAFSLLLDERARFKRNRITVEPELFFLLDNIGESQQKKLENGTIRFTEHPGCKFSVLTAMIQPFLDNLVFFRENKLNREIFSKILNIKDVESFIDGLLTIYLSEQLICDEIDRLSCSITYNHQPSSKQAYRIFEKLITLAQLKEDLLNSLKDEEIDIEKIVKESKKYIYEPNMGGKEIDINQYTQLNKEKAQSIKRVHSNMTKELKTFFETRKIREKKDDVKRQVLQEHIFWVYSVIFDLTAVSVIPSADI